MAGTETNPDVQVYRRRAYSGFLTTCSALMTATCATGLIAPIVWIRILMGCLTLSSALWTYRAARMATIIANPQGIHVRQYLKDKHLAWPQIRRFFTEPRPSGMGQPGRTLSAQLRDGTTVRFGEFFSLVRRDKTGPLLVDQLAGELNQQLATAGPSRQLSPEPE